MKCIWFNLFFVSMTCFASQEQKCPAMIDGFVQEYEVYRQQFFDSEISKCIPDNESYIMLRDKPESSIQITGFVVGIEQFYHPEFYNILKVTSKAGAHTTIVKLLAHKHGGNLFTESFNWDFDSSMDFISVSKNGPESLQVITRNNEHDGKCAWEIEDKYQFISGEFEKISTSEVERSCYPTSH
ncbi:MAG: hypothetical protein ACTIM4_07805 [Marinomonas sp.]